MRRWFRRTPEDPQDRIDRILTTYQREIAERLERGLADIQNRSAGLLRDVTAEVWQAGEVDPGLQERVLALLTRDAALRGLISHTDDRYQALDIRLTGLQERLKPVTDMAHEVRELLEQVPGRPDMPAPSKRSVEGLEQRMDALQRYLASVLEYEGERDQAVSEWLQRVLAHGRDAVGEQAGRVIEEVGAGMELETARTAQRVLDRLDEQTRTFAQELAAQEARIRLSMTEGRENEADLLREQIRVLDTIEADLTIELDERLGKLADTIQGSTAMAVDEAAERVGRQSAEAVNLGVKDLLAVIDRRFAWLEETIKERMASLEAAVGHDRAPEPSSDRVIRLPDELEPARWGHSAS